MTEELKVKHKVGDTHVSEFKTPDGISRYMPAICVEVTTEYVKDYSLFNWFPKPRLVFYEERWESLYLNVSGCPGKSESFDLSDAKSTGEAAQCIIDMYKIKEGLSTSIEEVGV